MSNFIISYALWSFLPNFITNFLQTKIYYGITIRAGEPHPQPGTPQFIKHRRNIYCFVIGAYLLYTIYEADWKLQRDGHFYQDLRVPIDVDLRTLKSHARRLKAMAHPDKADSQFRAQSDQLFINFKTAEETLVDPVKRFAYERFGPDILQWKGCITEGDYIIRGFQQLLPRYIGSVLFLLVAQFLGRFPHGTYWHYLTIVSLFVFESTTITRPHFPLVLTSLVNPIFQALRLRPAYLPFQIINIAQSAALSIFIAISQLAPAFKTGADAGADNKEAQQQQMNQLFGMAALTQQDTQRLLGLEVAPFKENEIAEKRLKEQLRVWLVQNELRNEAGVAAAIKRVAERRNEESELVG